MKRLNTLSALLSTKIVFPSSQRSGTATTAKPKQFEQYIDGQTYRKLASRHQAASAIEGFFRELVGQDAASEDVLHYLQQWNQGRSLRSIRDEIARCPKAQCWR